MYSIFYFHEQSAEVACSSIPVGTLDIGNLIKGEPCWRNINASEPQKKTLLLACWSSPRWALNELRQLLNEGFTILLWQKDGLPIEQLTIDNLEYTITVSSCNHSTPIEYDRMKEQVIQQFRHKKLNGNKIHILDEYWLNCLRSNYSEENLPAYREISAVDFKNYFKAHPLVATSNPFNGLFFSPSQSWKSDAIDLVTFFAQLNPPITKIKIHRIDGEEIKYSKELQKLIPNACIHNEIKELDIDYHDAILLLKKEAMVSFDHEVKIKELQSVKRLEFKFTEKKQDGNVLGKLLKFMPTLEKLTVTCEKTIFNQPVLNTLPKLKDLTLIGEIDLSYFYYLHKDNKITNLDIKNCIISGSEPRSFHFDELKEFTAVHSSTTPEVAVQLILNTTKLRYINITDEIDADEDYEHLPLPITILQISLCNLQTLNISHLSAEAATLEALLNKTPKLTALDAYNFFITDEDELSHIDLPYLTDLNLAYSNIEANSLSRFLSTSSQLANLDISNCKCINGDDLEIKQNLQISRIDLDGVPFDMHNLLQLLGKTPKIKDISISNCLLLQDGLSGEEQFDHPLNLRKLTDFKIYSNIHLDDLFYILKQAPKLKKLTLSEVTNYLDPASLEPFSLERLTKLKLTKSNIDTDTFFDLLSRTKQLESLLLLNCRDLLQDYSNPCHFNFENLYSIELYNSNISIANLFYLIKDANNIDQFKIEGCHIQGHIDTPICSPLDKVTSFDFKNNTITASNLFYLLRQLPNLESLSLQQSIVSNNSNEDFLLSLLNLESLVVDGARIGKPVLVNLLQGAPRLVTLTLSSFQRIEHVEINPLNQLNFLSIEASPCDALVSVLHKTPNVTLLTLNSLHGTLDFNETPYLANLQTLSIYGCRLSKSSILALNESYSLSQLALQYCTFIDGDKTLSSEEVKALLTNIPDVYIPEPSNYDYSGAGLRGNYWGNGAATTATPRQEKSFNIDNQLAPPKSNEFLDANTTPEKISFNVKPIFYSLQEGIADPSPTKYRKHIVHEIECNPESCTLNNAFILKHSIPTEEQLEPCTFQQMESGLYDFGKSLPVEPDATCYFGTLLINLSSQWQAIPSLSISDEEITHCSLQPQVNFQMKYCREDNQYWIKGDNAKVQVELIVKIKAPREESLSSQVLDIVEKYRRFTAGSLTIIDAHPTGAHFLKYIQTQEKGACRHRSFACKVELDALEQPNLCVSIINNDTHSFIEVNEAGNKVRCDLGGYPADTKLDKSAHPSIRAPKPPSLAIRPMAVAPRTPQPPVVVNPYIKALETWEKNTHKPLSIEDYFQRLLAPGIYRKHLIEYDSTQAVDNMIIVLETYLKDKNYPFFYVNSADKLICSAAFVQCHNNRGQITAGPGGPFYNFLKREQAGLPRILIINYEHFTADEIVRFNNLFAKNPSSDGTALPKDLILIGIMNISKPDCYKGNDFYSRFEGRPDSSPIPLATLEQLIQGQIQQRSNGVIVDNKPIVIDLFNLPNWKERLLGRWDIQGHNLSYLEGELKKHFQGQNNVTLMLKNAPWDNPQFAFFWNQALMLGYIENRDNNSKIPLPTHFQLQRSEGYDYDLLNNRVCFVNGLAQNALTLNPGTFNDYFIQYVVDKNTNCIFTQPGLIAAHRNQMLTVNVTRNLSNDEWAYFLTTCQEYNVRLTAYLPAIEPKLIVDKNSEPTGNTRIYYSMDIDANVLMATKGKGDYLIIDVSECEINDLFFHIHGALDPVQLQFLFEKQEKAIFTALENNEKVILKGSFSPSLVDALAPIIFKRMANSRLAPGELLIFSDSDKLFNAFPRYMYSVFYKSEFLIGYYDDPDEEIAKYDSFCRMNARLDYQECFPDNLDPEKAWEGILDLPLHFNLADFDEENSVINAKQFNEQRIQTVRRILSRQPYVALTGLSGTGKTTFVLEHLNGDGKTLFIGENNLINWALCEDPMPILFIDEANITKRLWTEFEGLYNPNPGILINGQWYPLRNHKVVFAFNPLSCGGERRVSSFFLRHGNAVVFEPMSLDFIFESVLKPVFPYPGQAAPNCRRILEIYRTLCEWSTTEILISPRELQMIALLAVSNPGQSVERYAYQLTRHLVPKQHLETFDSLYKTQESQVMDVDQVMDIEGEQSPTFLITKSRISIQQQLRDFLNLRQLRQEKFVHIDNDALLYGGLGGVILEGEPGIGKTELVQDCLKAMGLTYYDVPVSMQNDDKTALLLKAFHEGAIVVIDEINSSSMLERLLNDLLMGKTPEGERPHKPGFMIIATQNPCTMDGRRAASTALARRVLTIIVPEYTAEEMHSILVQKGIEPRQATAMVAAYEFNLQRARNEFLKPAPAFRDLCNLVATIPLANPSRGATFFFTKKRKAEENICLENPQKRVKVDSNINQMDEEFEAPKGFDLVDSINSPRGIETDENIPMEEELEQSNGFDFVDSIFNS